MKTKKTSGVKLPIKVGNDIMLVPAISAEAVCAPGKMAYTGSKYGYYFKIKVDKGAKEYFVTYNDKTGVYGIVPTENVPEFKSGLLMMTDPEKKEFTDDLRDLSMKLIALLTPMGLKLQSINVYPVVTTITIHNAPSMTFEVFKSTIK